MQEMLRLEVGCVRGFEIGQAEGYYGSAEGLTQWSEGVPRNAVVGGIRLLFTTPCEIS